MAALTAAVVGALMTAALRPVMAGIRIGSISVMAGSIHVMTVAVDAMARIVMAMSAASMVRVPVIGTGTMVGTDALIVSGGERRGVVPRMRVRRTITVVRR
jgi:hypothetical protein